MAIGVPFGILIVIILIISDGDVLGTDAKYALLLIGILFLLTFLFVMIVYGGKYAPGFVIDHTGITNYTQAGQRKKNKIINALLVTFGLFSGNHAILVRGGYTEKIVVFCTKENYAAAAAMIRQRVGHGKES